jgi:integrase
MSIHSRATSAPFLRLLFAEDIERPKTQTAASTVDRSSQTLSAFFESWYLPVVLIGEHQSGLSAVKPYREALKRWEAATQHAPLSTIDPLMLASVKTYLRAATYSRGPGKPTRPVKPATIRKWQACLRFVLSRLGPPTPWDPKATAGILNAPPTLSIDNAPRDDVERVKPSYTLAQAAAIMRSCEAIQSRATKRRPGKRSTIAVATTNPMSGTWFRAWFALLFYTGLRADKTALALRRRHCHVVDQQWWLKVPGDLVPKTDKPIRLPLHPCLVQLIEQSHMRPLADIADETFLCPWPMGYSHLARLSAWVAKQAGLPALSPHAWRRTFGALVADPTQRRLDVAAAALDHASATTTAASYVAVEAIRAREILALPNLWPTQPSTSYSSQPPS